MPAPSRIIFNDKPRSIRRHINMGTIESASEINYKFRIETGDTCKKLCL